MYYSLLGTLDSDLLYICYIDVLLKASFTVYKHSVSYEIICIYYNLTEWIN
jgi:hypothetical protein